MKKHPLEIYMSQMRTAFTQIAATPTDYDFGHLAKVVALDFDRAEKTLARGDSAQAVSIACNGVTDALNRARDGIRPDDHASRNGYERLALHDLIEVAEMDRSVARKLGHAFNVACAAYGLPPQIQEPPAAPAFPKGVETLAITLSGQPRQRFLA